MQANYGKLPLSFEANQGQTDAQVKFLARGQGYTLFLTPTETVLSLKKPQAKAKISQSSAKSSSASEAIGTVLRMQLAGANSAPKVVGREPLPGHVNYLIGKDPGQWHTQVPTYGKVAYEGVYPGVDLVYYGNQGQLEYDFVVAPGADPHNIKLTFQGANNIKVTPAGELVLHTANGDLRMHKPVIYQQIEGVRQPIAGSYALKADQTVGFQVAAYDAAHPLIIDPVLVYSTYLGGSGNDDSSDITVDLQGRAYVTGTTDSSDFPTMDALQPTKSGDKDAFVAKLSTDGRALRYATYLGGNSSDSGNGIAVDLLGQAVVTGFTDSPDFPTKNALQPNLKTGIVLGDAFVAKLSADGRALHYATYLGGSSNDGGNGIAVDLRGQAYVTGFTDSPDFPTKNALQPTKDGDTDGFVAKLSADGRALRYSTYLGAGNDDSGSDIAVDLRGRAYVAGFTQSPGFPTKNAQQPTINGLAPGDAFVTQLSASGSTLGYSTYLGGSDNEIVGSIAVDLRGQAYVIGTTRSPDFPTKNALQSALGGSEDAFVAKFSPTGALRYSTYLGGRDIDVGGGIAVDRQGQAYVTGGTVSSAFPIVNPLQADVSGNGSVFVAKFSADGLTLRYSTYLGGKEGSGNGKIAVDRKGQAYVTGTTQSTDFPTANALQPTLGGGVDAFVAKIGSNDQP
ncbi:SBBP repeat-containing protein [Methylobacter sp.]|uniref:DUF7948 domain-containing protein n=1 Tax=Methylobacter sp. TaxID=2051955 RepID=UPI003DA59442